MKGEALRLIHTNSSRATFEENVNKFESLLCDRGYPKRWIETLLSDIRIHREGISAEAKKKWKSKRYLALCATVSPGSAKLKTCFVQKVAPDAKLLYGKFSKGQHWYPLKEEDPAKAWSTERNFKEVNDHTYGTKVSTVQESCRPVILFILFIDKNLNCIQPEEESINTIGCQQEIPSFSFKSWPQKKKIYVRICV